MAQTPPGSIILHGPQSAPRDHAGATAEQKAMIVKAAQAFKTEAAKAQAEYFAAYAVLTNPPILNMAQVTNKFTLHSRETKVKEYLVASIRFQDFGDHFIEHLDEQTRTNIPDESIRKVLHEGFASSWEKVQPQRTMAREAEVRRAQDYLKALKLLEANWGKWQWETNDSVLVLEGNGLTLEYNEIVRDISACRVEEVKAHNAAAASLSESPK
jgi:hypothetical protein